MYEAANTDGKTVLYVSHNMATIRQLCSRCIVLKEGKLIFDGDVQSAIRVYSDEALTMDMKGSFPEISNGSPAATHTAKMLGFEILEKDTLIFRGSEKLKMRIHYNCFEDFDSEVVRLTLKYAGVNFVGTHFSEKFAIRKGDNFLFKYLDESEDVEYVLELPTTLIKTRPEDVKTTVKRMRNFNALIGCSLFAFFIAVLLWGNKAFWLLLVLPLWYIISLFMKRKK
jgi:hypothetical protein